MSERPVRKAEQPDLPTPVDEDLAHPTFRPRRTARLVTGLLLLSSLGVTALLAREAYVGRADLVAADLVPVGIAAALTLVLWAVRSTTSVARLSVEDGQLTITRNGETWRCDLTGRATPVEVVGRPGRRGWKVVFARRGRPPYVVDASMVDPVHFTRVLAHYRPDVTGPPDHAWRGGSGRAGDEAGSGRCGSGQTRSSMRTPRSPASVSRTFSAAAASSSARRVASSRPWAAS